MPGVLPEVVAAVTLLPRSVDVLETARASLLGSTPFLRRRTVGACAEADVDDRVALRTRLSRRWLLANLLSAANAERDRDFAGRDKHLSFLFSDSSFEKIARIDAPRFGFLPVLLPAYEFPFVGELPLEFQLKTPFELFLFVTDSIVGVLR